MLQFILIIIYILTYKIVALYKVILKLNNITIIITEAMAKYPLESELLHDCTIFRYDAVTCREHSSH